MALFSKKVVKEIYGRAWGHLALEHKIDGDTLSREIRCVERKGSLNGAPVTFLRVFKLGEARAQGVTIAGWETFDQRADLILFEGYLTESEAHLERKAA